MMQPQLGAGREPPADRIGTADLVPWLDSASGARRLEAQGFGFASRAIASGGRNRTHSDEQGAADRVGCRQGDLGIIAAQNRDQFIGGSLLDPQSDAAHL